MRQRRRRCCRKTVRFLVVASYSLVCNLIKRESALSVLPSGFVGSMSGGRAEGSCGPTKLSLACMSFPFFLSLTSSLPLFPLFDLKLSSFSLSSSGYSDFVSHFRTASSYIANHRSKTMVVLLPGEVKERERERERERGYERMREGEKRERKKAEPLFLELQKKGLKKTSLVLF